MVRKNLSESGGFPASTRSQLRLATHDAHRRLDDGLASLHLARRTDYCAFLAASAAALIPLETLITASGAAHLLPDWDARARSMALLGDLDGLGVELTARPLAQRDFGTAELFGVLYVLEGSRLGAKMLVRQVRESGDPAVRAHCRYLAHGESDGLWPSFLARLEAAPDVRRNLQQAIDGALFAFSVFEAAVAKPRHVTFGKALHCA